ncbi:peptidase S8/S53 domain-containing protein [Phycomyces blakesleeanus]|uniref:Peptidase S8/S53 domain-containing protein n=2 Tax=Phycomyces blakesleeanus TaxID=4837 RepID=A0ABR3B2C2_PHYBL
MTGVFHDKSFLDYLGDQGNVDYIEPNNIYKSNIRLPDEHFGKRSDIRTSPSPDWGLSRISQRLSGTFDSYTYEATAGSGITVYVLDTGVNTEHSDFDNRASLSINLVHNEPETDMGGHGTHVAGKIAGKTYGVAKSARIRSVKILGQSGDGTTASLVKGISHVIETAEPGKSVINLSLSGPKSRMIDEVLSKAARDYNIPIFVSAGNAGTDACYFSPSSNQDVFVVGATNINDEVPLFSNVGQCVHLYAPGSNIKSTWIGSSTAIQSLDGTSMACPHVTGIAASLLSTKNYRNVHELYDEIRSIATKDLLKFKTVVHISQSHNLLAYAPYYL